MTGSGSAVVVRCPRCGSTDSRSVEAVGIEFDRMRCGTCGHEEVCDADRIRSGWNERIPLPAPAFVLPTVRFRALWTALGARGPGRETLLRLRAAYAEAHRAYHTAEHVSACLRLLDDPAVRALAERPAEVEAALWFHDAVYDTRASDNEGRSARLAEDSLRAAGVAADVAARVADHVRATGDHGARTADGKLVVDVDLSILGSDRVTFDRFERDIRAEYAWVDDASFAAARAAVLGRFAARPSIYAKDLLRERFESRARQNVADALRRLSREPGSEPPHRRGR